MNEDQGITSETNTFIKNFMLDEVEDDMSKLAVSCYFALTTLSTVGYGDYYPVSNVERIVAVGIMLGGVAFFSYIMGNFIEIITNYEKKMGVVDQSGDLHNWMMLLTRFTNNQPLPQSLTSQIEQNFSYYWSQDRLACLNTDDQYLESLPRKAKNQIMTVYLFSDIFSQFKRFFVVGAENETKFMYDIAFGFMPRKFECLHDEDKIIYDEEEEVIEMYFITEGIVGIGFSLIANGYVNDKYVIATKLASSNSMVHNSEKYIICDHYVVNKSKSQFIYMAIDIDVKCFALTRNFIHEEIFPKYPEIAELIQQESFQQYKKQIFKPVNKKRKEEIAKMNKKSVYRKIQMDKIKDSKGSHSELKPWEQTHMSEHQRLNSNFKIAEEIVAHNLQENIKEVSQEINFISKGVQDMTDNFDEQINDILK